MCVHILGSSSFELNFYFPSFFSLRSLLGAFLNSWGFSIRKKTKENIGRELDV